jgi:predicted 2-oxoglutarate/Fe(II)-dependent dioxygenase YbiX
VVTQELKRRRDHTLAPSPLEQRVRGLLEARVFPEVEKGLQRAVALAEALRVGAYRAQDRGFFAAHRDDANAATGRRRFALAVNLNTGSYEGGRLTFPEYEDAMDVPRGCAVVYSVALLHAVSEVTHGARLALVGFLGDR